MKLTSTVKHDGVLYGPGTDVDDLDLTDEQYERLIDAGVVAEDDESEDSEELPEDESEDTDDDDESEDDEVF